MDRNQIQDAMNTITHGVYVIGTHLPEINNLMTAAWLTQVSTQPQMIMVAISDSHLTTEIIKITGEFVISVLGENQKNEAMACGTVSGREVDKTSLINTKYTEDGYPLVENASAYLRCKVLDAIHVTSHVVFSAVVVEAEYMKDSVMLYRTRTK